MHVFPLIFIICLLGTLSGEEACKQGENCKLPACRCAKNNLSSHNISIKDTPQFVILTFDDAMNILNNVTYYDIFRTGRKNKRNGCPITGTFFITHEYNDYTFVHEYWRYGHEMSSHSISHKPKIEEWKKASVQEWKDEMVDMRKIISKYGNIPETEITGTRAPFLQTSGNDYFTALTENNFKWDSSMPTRKYSGKDSFYKMYPYTLNFGFTQDCVITPCPNKTYNGFWLLPMVMQYRSNILEDGTVIEIPCSMIDACSPQPETREETLMFLKKNFNEHYQTNRSPMPIYLHETWLKNEERKLGYLQFLDWVLNKDDVFVVTVSEMLEYFKNPTPLSEYVQKKCVKQPSENKCIIKSACAYEKEKTPFEGPRYMSICGGDCPEYYPWLNNPFGTKP